jgi:NADH:ubiquinone oxidoreductase subunit 6 (subunit J)
MTPEQQITISILLLTAMVAATLWTVMTSYLLRAAVGLALTSAILAVIMFMLSAPIAGVFELSVCAGLIPAIFLSAISVTKRLQPDAMVVQARQQIRRFWALPLILVLVGLGLSHVHIPELAVKIAAVPENDVRKVLWNMRHLDLLGQIVILLGGAFGVVVLLKEKEPKSE